MLKFLTQSNVYYTIMWTPLKLQLKYTSMILGIDFILMKCETNMTKTSSAAFGEGAPDTCKIREVGTFLVKKEM